MDLKWVVLNTFFLRLKGLMGARDLPDNTMYILLPCSSIHTFGMKLPIDVLFFDKYGKVLRLCKHVNPGIVIAEKGAYGVAEGKVGIIDKYAISLGSTIPLQDIRSADGK